MKKKFLLASMLFTMAVSMVACGDKSASSKEKEVQQETVQEQEENISSVADSKDSVDTSMSEETIMTVTEEEETDSDILNLTIEDSVLYNENGVTITFEGFEYNSMIML